MIEQASPNELRIVKVIPLQRTKACTLSYARVIGIDLVEGRMWVTKPFFCYEIFVDPKLLDGLHHGMFVTIEGLMFAGDYLVIRHVTSIRRLN